MLDLAGYEIVDERIEKNGCYCRQQVWIKGWHTFSAKFAWRQIHGLTGPETYIVVERIRPLIIFEVIALTKTETAA
jgi:hypothetical protein